MSSIASLLCRVEHDRFIRSFFSIPCPMSASLRYLPGTIISSLIHPRLLRPARQRQKSNPRPTDDDKYTAFE